MKVHDFVFSDGTVRSVEVLDVPLSFLLQAETHRDDWYPRMCFERGTFDGYDHLGKYVLVTARICFGVPDDKIHVWEPCERIETCGCYLEGYLATRLPIQDELEEFLCSFYQTDCIYETYYEIWHVVDDLVGDVDVFDIQHRAVKEFMVYDGCDYYCGLGETVPAYGLGTRFGGVSTGVDCVMRDYFTGEPWPDFGVGRYLVVSALSRFGKVYQPYLIDCCDTLSDAYDQIGYNRIQERAFCGGLFVKEGGCTLCSSYEIWHVVGDLRTYSVPKVGLWGPSFQCLGYEVV